MRKTLMLALSPVICLNVATAADTTGLDGIEIREQAVSPPLSESPLGVTFSGGEMLVVPGSGGDVLRAVDSLPGMAINDDRDAEPAIRGSRPESNLYYIDFMPTGYLFHFTGNSVVDGDLVERFDLLPAGYGAAYQDGLGGVIDVTTRDPESLRGGMVDVSLIEAGVLVEGEVKPGQRGFLSARMSYYDLLLEDVIDDDDEDFQILQLPKFFDYRGKYVVDLPRQRTLRLFLDGAADEVGFVVKDTADVAFQDPALVGDYNIDVAYHRQAVTLEKNREDGSGYEIGLSHRFGVNNIRTADAGETLLDIDYSTLKGEYRFADRGRQRWRLGGELSRIGAEYDVGYRDPGCTEFEVDCRISDAEKLFSNGSLTVNQLKLFAEDSRDLTDRLRLTAGLGINSDDYLDEVHAEPRLRLDYSFSDDTTLSGALGRYHELPEFAQVENVFGNPSLAYLESDHYVLGLEQNRKDGWFWKTELYYKSMSNLVTADEAETYDNDGSGTAVGAELLVKKAFGERWSGWLSLSWSEVDRKDDRTGETFSFEYDQPWIASLVARRTINPRLSLSGKLRYHSGSPYTPILGGEEDTTNPGTYRAVYGAINSQRLPHYLRLDLRADMVLGEGDWTLYGELINATGHKNVSGYEYSPDFSTREDVEQLPRFVYFGVKKTW